MYVSQARIDANRKNSARSTGPKTPEGKAISRANALKHGLCATVLVAEDVGLVQRRAEEVYIALLPQNEFHCWLVDQVAVHSVRVDRCERIERRVRDKVALRAELTWDDDRRREAEILGAMLPGKPSENVDLLRRSPHGCEWLITRWAMLAYAFDRKKAWSPEQTALAFDLLATPHAFREGHTPGVELDLEGRPVEAEGDLAALARRRIAELKERRDAVSDLDEVERALAMVDLNDDDPELRRVRRHEATLHRRLRWYITQINAKPSHDRVIPGTRPEWHDGLRGTPAPEPKTAEEVLAMTHPADSFQPPFDLDPDEEPPIGQKADIPAVLNSRKAKRVAKAEAQRQARRRRLDQYRA